MDIISKKIVNLNSLQLQGMDWIVDGSLHCLSRIAGLAHLDLSVPSQGCHVGNIKDRGVRHLGNLHALKDLQLENCMYVADVGLSHLASLTSLTRLDMFNCHSITDQSVVFLGLLIALRDLNLGQLVNLTDSGVLEVAQLTSLTRLDLSNSTSGTDLVVSNLRSLYV